MAARIGVHIPRVGSDAQDCDNVQVDSTNDIPSVGHGIRRTQSRGETWQFRVEEHEHTSKTEEQIQGLRKRQSRHFNPMAKEGIVDYYRRHNNTLYNYKEMDALSNSFPEAMQGEATTEPYEQVAMWLSFSTNCVLLGLKIFASFMSGSLAIIASTLDSFLDIISGFILFFTNRALKRPFDITEYPVGKNRMQPLGIVVFSSIMGTVGFTVLVEAVRQLIGEEHTHHLEDLGWIITIMCSVILLKFLLWLFCRRFESEAVRTYAQDHLNDVFTNSLGLATAILGDRFAYWIDPLGAILLAAYITRNWGLTALENIRALVGVAAPPELVQKITYLCWNHHEQVQKIDTVRAYTFGNYYLAEVDIVLPPTMTLTNAHDIGEALQYKLEALPEIERAFVHLDYETLHRPEHGPATPSG
eukprot:CAMPEP_0182913614 /NCGR_PEP_ID=MMETSP0034_2-20130328/38131_1 /TAXON_ID=156128 /ORGANISM="Nephroselmis pyriformis, Strain CCMP717" /LENGTH=414 /DNA_ID=CAMNT_0025050341 /DNA_START=40 /DNA_END=1281 /DNA_ORIENTATION=+